MTKRLAIHQPQQGLYIQGGAGAGKSASIFEPAIYNFLTKGFSGLIYDFKGRESPLSHCAYNTLRVNGQTIKRQGYNVPEFHYFNMTSPFMSTGKINPINPAYISSKLYADAAAEVLFKNLDKSAIQKPDFWTNNGINYTAACIWRLVRLAQHDPEYAHICTLPHLVTLMLQPIHHVVNFLLQDPEIGPTVASIKTAYEQQAGDQLSGVEASAQIPISKLYEKHFFYMLTPDGEDEEIPLRINDPARPVVLCLANHESLKAAISPVLSVIIGALINALNDAGAYHKTFLCLDELPTIYIKGLDVVPATMRSKQVVTMVGVQEYSQLVRDYGKEEARVIVGNLGNQFFGMTNDREDAETIARMFGHKEKLTTSTSTNDSGSSSSLSWREKRVLQSTDIMGQPVGHFAGKVADGDPPFFYCQFPDGRFHQLTNKPLAPLPNDRYPFPAGVQEDKAEEHAFQQSVYEELVEENFARINQDIEELLYAHVSS